MKSVDFMSIGESAYFEPLLLSIHQIQKFYPQSSIHIYDWGFTNDEQKILQSEEHVILIPWTLQLYQNTPTLNRWAFIKKIVRMASFKDALYTIFKNPSAILNIATVHTMFMFEQKIYNKFLCIKNHSETFGTNFIFLDADAFLINPINELLEKPGCDIGVTIRRKHELSFTYNNCQVINSGVIAFLGGHIKNLLFITAWEHELHQTHELIAEQTSLTRMLQKKDSEILDGNPKTASLLFGDNTMTVSVLPCDIYNFNWIEEFNPEIHAKKVKILHFKSSRFKTPLFKHIVSCLGL